jgi:hypothetical protein
MQALFISTGCDSVLYFRSMGKATILNVFFQHAQFICGESRPVFIHETSSEAKGSGFLSFIRLVGACYFKKHLAVFVSVYGHETPSHLFNSVDSSLEPPQKHEMWLQRIRDVVSDRITNEEERVPTHTSLWRHWLRSCWVSQMWQNSHLSDQYSSLPLPQTHGWTLSSDGVFGIDWKAPEVQEMINDTIQLLTKGCHCKTGCKSKVCGCRKKTRYCGPGCDCHCCTNLPSVSPLQQEVESGSDSEYDMDGSSDEMPTETEVITEDFMFTVPEIV